MINLLRALMEKVENMKEQRDNVSREMEIIRKSQKKVVENKNTVTEMKSAFDGLTNRVGTAKERVSGFEEMSTETFKMEM